MGVSKSGLVLMLLVAVEVYAVDAARTITGTKSQQGHSKNELPSTLLEYLSPLETTATTAFGKLIEDGSMPLHIAEFCAAAKLTCDANLPILDPTLEITSDGILNLFENHDLVKSSEAWAFGEKALVIPDSDKTLPSPTQDTYPTISFLPRSIAHLLPFASEKMPQLLETFNIPYNSNMGIMMVRTLAMCEAPLSKEGRTCVTSVEDMVDFVNGRLHGSSKITPLERSSMTGPQQSLKVLDSKVYDSAVMCHKTMFPYAVYMCHDISQSNMKIYSASLEAHDGKIMQGVAACQSSTQGWKPLETTSTSLESKAGETCHWISDTFVWVPQA